jgi:subtilisin-like proprotein convertase family protein
MKLLANLPALLVLCCLAHTPLAAQTFNGTGGPITDDSQNNDYIINVSGLTPSSLDATHGLINICFDITHTYDEDLEAELIAPDGTVLLLWGQVGGGDDNFTNTCLEEGSGTSIGQGTAPFTGTFEPLDNMGNVNNGQNGNGQWIFRIRDTWAQDNGTLNNWNITFGPNASAPITVTSSNLPIIIVTTVNGQSILDDPKINANMSIIYNGPGVTNFVTDPGTEYDGNIGIEIRGAFSASLPQKPFGLELRTSANLDTSVSLFNMGKEEDWILQATYNDKAFMRNTLAFEMFSEMGNYGAEFIHCELIVNGSYRGIYMLGEKIKRDDDRVDIAGLNATENTGIDLTGGYIFKTDYWNGSNSWESNFSPIDHPTLDVHFTYHYPKPDNITTAQQNYIQSYVDAFETALYGPNFTTPGQGYAEYIEVNTFLDYFIINEVARNNDGFKKSRYYHKDIDTASSLGLLKAGPVWDFDWAWLNVNECSIFAATDGSGWAHHINDCNPDVNSPGWYIRMLQDTSFVNALYCRYNLFRTTVGSDANIIHYIDSVAAHLDSAQVRHYDKWGTLGVDVGTPEVGTQPADYAGDIQFFKDWILQRLAWLDVNIVGNCYSVGIGEEPVQLALRAFPNPATDLVYVEGIPNDQGTLLLYDITGKQVHVSMSTYENHTELHVQFLDPGVYLLQWIGADGQKSKAKRLIKQ